jgi:hypothetical protein
VYNPAQVNLFFPQGKLFARNFWKRQTVAGTWVSSGRKASKNLDPTRSGSSRQGGSERSLPQQKGPDRGECFSAAAGDCSQPSEAGTCAANAAQSSGVGVPGPSGRGWKDALHIVKPDTLLRWHRQGFKLYWRQKSKGTVRRSQISEETIALIKEMAVENRLWGHLVFEMNYASWNRETNGPFRST